MFLRRRAYLDELVPAARDNDGVLGVGAEADARNPFGVALVGDGELAVTEGVPELDGTVARSGNDLSVIGGERDGENVVGVADESSRGRTGSQLPESEGLVPRSREGVGAVRGDDLKDQSVSKPCRELPSRAFQKQQIQTYAVGDDVGVTVERSLGVSVLRLVAGEVPDN